MTRTERTRKEEVQGLALRQPVHQGSQPPQDNLLNGGQHVVPADQQQRPLLP